MMMAGLSLEYEGVITSGDLHIATRDGEAMFFHDSIDFSAYAGTDGGSTPYRLVFTDSAGKVATAYGGAAGGGEALTELLTNGNMETGSPPDDWTPNAVTTATQAADERTDGAGSYSLNIADDGSARPMASQSGVPLLLGRLYLCSAWIKRISATAANGTISLTNVISLSRISSASTSWAFRSYYWNSTHTTTTSLEVHGTGANQEFRFDDVSFSYLTDIPATGLHLMSTKNGTTRNMASVETGFNPNTIVGVQIYG